MGRRLIGVLTMLGGGAGTLGLLVALNQTPAEREGEAHQVAVAFEVPPPPPPPPQVERKPPPRRTTRTAAPPAPSLGSSLAGLDLGLDSGALLAGMADGLLGDTSGVVMTEDAVDQPPRPASRPAGPYPARARARGETGRVLLRVLVQADGTVGRMTVEEAEPPGVFEEAALATVAEWTFEPGRYRGAPVPAWVRVPVRFELEG